MDIETLMATLRPFAEDAKRWDDKVSEMFPIAYSEPKLSGLRVGDLRRAAEAYAALDGGVERCPTCGGVGEIPTADEGEGLCTDCGGSGVTYQTERRCACQPVMADGWKMVPVVPTDEMLDAACEHDSWAPSELWPIMVAAAPASPVMAVGGERRAVLEEALKCTKRCDKEEIEQNAFEQWAIEDGYDMDKHPLHWLFLNPKTNAARQGWAAALAFVGKRISALSASPSLSQERDTVRNSVAVFVDKMNAISRDKTLPSNILDALRELHNSVLSTALAAIPDASERTEG